jgi:hypothetical protein
MSVRVRFRACDDGALKRRALGEVRAAFREGADMGDQGLSQRGEISTKTQPQQQGTVKIEGFSKARAFLDKMGREIGRLKYAQENNGSNDDVSDHGLNAASTGWHMFESIAKERCLKKKEYRDRMKELCPDLGLLHDLATQTKHFSVTAPQRANADSDLSVKTSSRSTLTDDEEQKILNDLKENPMPATYFHPKNNFQTVLKIDGRDALEVLGGVYTFWETQLSAKCGNGC